MWGTAFCFGVGRGEGRGRKKGREGGRGEESVLRVLFAVLPNFSGFHGYRTSKT